MSDLDRPLRSPALYNPHLLSRDELLELFHARRALLDRLLEDLRSAPEGQPAQHHLIVGQRGMGKTMLLRRLEIAVDDDPELSQRWVPLAFPEEQYNVAFLSDFWLNCIDALSDRFERFGEAGQVRELDRQVEGLEDLPEAERAARALKVLLDAARSSGRRLLLLVDNADLVLERIEEQQWALREVLSAQPLVTFLGASAALLETTYEYGKAFYDFFDVHPLSGLGAEETRDLLLNYARAQGSDEVRRIAEEEHGRLRTLHRLTGGNPRTLVLLFNILAQTAGGDVRTDLEQLLDQSTPLYKARFEALPPQAQQVVDGLALSWDPITAADLAAAVRLEVNAVSSQLNRLVKAGVVEKVLYEPASRAGFQLAERFFNIWYLMRASRRVRRRLIWLVEFLRMFYGEEDLATQARAHLRLAPGFSSKDRLRHAEYSFALAQASALSPLREALERSGLRVLSGHEQLRRELRDLIDLDSIEPAFLSRVEELERFEHLKKTLSDLRAKPEYQKLIPFLLRAPLSVSQKETLAKKLKAATTEELKLLSDRWEEFEKSIFGIGGAGAPLSKVLDEGMMLSLDDVEGAEDAETVYEVKGLVATAAAVRLENRDDPAAKQALESALPETASAYPWLVWLEKIGIPSARRISDPTFEQVLELAQDHGEWLIHLGNLVREAPEGIVEAATEKALRCFRRAVDVAPNHPGSWNNYGLSLVSLTRLGEAEDAYREGLRLSPDHASLWFNLGLLLEREGRFDEAEDAYRRKVEAEPLDAHAWFHFGTVSLRCGHLDEAERSLRRAVEIAPNQSAAWGNLGIALWRKEQFQDAEQAFRRATETDPGNAVAWTQLSDTIQCDGQREAEAEEAVRRALEIDPDLALAWDSLALLLKDGGRFEEAVEARRRHLALAPGDVTALNDYAWLVFKRRRDPSEAERAAKAAVAQEAQDPHLQHTLACILARNEKWDEAEEAARIFLCAWADELPKGLWPDVLLFFREAVATGRAREAVELLDDLGLSERWRPLREALQSVALDNPAYLRRIAPEVRDAAESILLELQSQDSSTMATAQPVAGDAPARSTEKPARRGSRRPRPRKSG